MLQKSFKNRLIAVFLVAIMLVSSFPHFIAPVFAQGTTASLLPYEVVHKVSEDGTEDTIFIQFLEVENVKLEKVTLPDGNEILEKLSTVSYVASDDGIYEFKVNYLIDEIEKEEIIPVEVSGLEEKIQNSDSSQGENNVDLLNNEITNPDEVIPEIIEFNHEDWVTKRESIPGTQILTLDLIKPRKELKAKRYVIPGSIIDPDSGKKRIIRLGNERQPFTFDNKLQVETFKVGDETDKATLPTEQSYFLSSFRSTPVKHLDLSGLDVSCVARYPFQMSGAFSDNEAIETLDLSGWDVSEIEDMSRMFANSTNLREIKFDGWDTSKVQNMTEMFLGCTSLHNANFDEFDMQNVISINSMFERSGINTTENLKPWKFQNLTNMAELFLECRELEKVDLAGWNTSAVTDMSEMFYFYQTDENNNTFSKITTIKGLNTWDVSSVKDMNSMFEGCRKLSEINLENWQLNKIANMEEMFNECTSLENVNFKNWRINNAVNMYSMFGGCQSLKTLEGFSGWEFVSNIKYENERTTTDMSDMFSSCSNLTSLEGVNDWKLSNIENTSRMFLGCINLSSIAQLKNWNVSDVKNMSAMFGDCVALKSLNGLQDWDVSNVKDMSGMFFECLQLQNLNELENWDTVNVKDMSQTFSNCFSLKNLDGLQNWTVDNVKTMLGMFALCPNIETLKPLENWKVGKVQDFSAMFIGGLKLTSLDGLENWKPNNSESISHMFALCKNINDFTAIENWQMPKLENFNNAFLGCEKLKTLNISNWKLGTDVNQINISGMFNHCPELLFMDFVSLDDFKGEVVAESIFDTAGDCELGLMIQNEIEGLKEAINFILPDVDPNECIPVDENEYAIKGAENVPLMVLSNHNGLQNSLNISANNGRIKYSFDIIYDGNGRTFKNGNPTHDDVITGTNFAYSNENAVVEDFVSIINTKGNELVENAYVDWYLDKECQKHVSEFDNFMQQVKKDINVFAKYSAQVSYEFVSKYEDKNLPQGVLNLLPESHVVDCGTTVKPRQDKFNTVPDGNGLWEFSKWERNEIKDIQTHQTIKGIWIYKENGIDLNNIPTIAASDKTITVGGTFNPLENVTATDIEDGDLTKDIEVIENNVNTSKAGVYKVIYRVTDKAGASTTKTIKVTVRARDVIIVPNTGVDSSNGSGTNQVLFTTFLTISALAITVVISSKKKQSDN